MSNGRLQSGLAGIVFLAAVVGLPAQTVTSAESSGSDAFAQAEKSSAVVTWTREKLAAAKKRWAQDQEKFSGCSKQLSEQHKANRPSAQDQGHFLQDCMSKNP